VHLGRSKQTVEIRFISVPGISKEVSQDSQRV
jgi:hypothetical protein